MGIRFRCHVCDERLHVKFFQAGRKGRCPHCQSRFRVPNEDSDFSIPLESAKRESKAISSNVNDEDSPKVEEAIASVATMESPSAEPPPPETSTPIHLPAHARWFVRPPSGGVYGPADTRTLESWISQRRVTADSYIWREGMDIWCLASELMPDAFGLAPGANRTLTESAPPPVLLPEETTKEPTLERVPNAAIAKAKANLDQRRQKKKKQTWIIMGLLIAIALGLIATLFVVLRG
jgi:hypothetical protein